MRFLLNFMTSCPKRAGKLLGVHVTSKSNMEAFKESNVENSEKKSASLPKKEIPIVLELDREEEEECNVDSSSSTDEEEEVGDIEKLLNEGSTSRNWASTHLRFLNPKTATRAQVRQDILKHQKEVGEDEDLETSVESLVMPRSSLDDFVLPTKPAPKKKPSGPSAKSNADWQQEVNDVRAWLRHQVLPFECETNAVKKHRFLKRIKTHWALRDGRVSYYHRRPTEDRGKYIFAVQAYILHSEGVHKVISTRAGVHIGLFGRAGVHI